MGRWTALVLGGLVVACSESTGGGGGLFSDGSVIVWEAVADGGGQPLVDATASDSGAPDADAGSGDPSDLGPDAGVEPDVGVDPCRVPAVQALSATVAVARPELLGEMVIVTGTPEPADVVCDAVECPVDNPCCNDCSGAVAIDGVLRLADSACLTLSAGCRGTTCTLVCSPPLLGIAERFRGRLRENATLEVFEILTSDAP
jgi:hypothetical protein